MLFLPELSCTKPGIEPIGNCVDVAKLSAAMRSGIFDTHFEYYFDIFSYATITVVQFMSGGEKEEHRIYHQPRKDGRNQEQTFFVVTLRDQFAGIEEGFGFGYINVTVYS